MLFEGLTFAQIGCCCKKAATLDFPGATGVRWQKFELKTTSGDGKLSRDQQATNTSTSLQFISCIWLPWVIWLWGYSVNTIHLWNNIFIWELKRVRWIFIRDCSLLHILWNVIFMFLQIPGFLPKSSLIETDSVCHRWPRAHWNKSLSILSEILLSQTICARNEKSI